MSKNEVQAMRLRLESLYHDLDYAAKAGNEWYKLDPQQIQDLRDFMDTFLWS